MTYQRPPARRPRALSESALQHLYLAQYLRVRSLHPEWSALRAQRAATQAMERILQRARLSEYTLEGVRELEQAKRAKRAASRRGAPKRPAAAAAAAARR
eukprot:tig00000180_g13631.t1